MDGFRDETRWDWWTVARFLDVGIDSVVTLTNSILCDSWSHDHDGKLRNEGIDRLTLILI